MAYGYALPRDPTEVVGRRITAYVIDALLGLVVLGLALALAKHQTYRNAPSDACSILRARSVTGSGSAATLMCVPFGSHLVVWKRGAFLTAYGLFALIGILDLVVLQAITGASVGKLALGLRVVDEQGRRAGFGRTIVRWILLVIDGGIFVIGLVTVLATTPHRRVGDFAAGTYVVATGSVGRPVRAVRSTAPYATAAYAVPGYAVPPPPPGHDTPVPSPPGSGVPAAPPWTPPVVASPAGWGTQSPPLPSPPPPPPQWGGPPTAPAGPSPAVSPSAPPSHWASPPAVPPQWAAPPPPVAPPVASAPSPSASPPAPPFAPPPPVAPSPSSPPPVAPPVAPVPSAPAPAPLAPPAPPAPSPAPPRGPAEPLPSGQWSPATSLPPPAPPPPAPAPRPAAPFAPASKPAPPATEREPEAWWDRAIPSELPDDEEQS